MSLMKWIALASMFVLMLGSTLALAFDVNTVYWGSLEVGSGGLTSGGELLDQNVNISSNVTFGNIILNGNLTMNEHNISAVNMIYARSGVFRDISGGSITTRDPFGYDNVRIGTYSTTPRIMFEDENLIGQIDFLSNSFRFIINDITT